MEKQEFKVFINAPRERVWDVLWNDTTYPAWTAVFSEGSRAVTDWKKGSKVLFVDGQGSGMVSTIAESKPAEFMSFKHLGMIKDGVEDTTSDEVKKWAGAVESYSLKPADGNTELTVQIDLSEEWKDYFVTTFPKALDKVKELAEKN
ncbi:MAG TPA: SRPBCC domain-containing protein [Chitinophagaceae bacterium]